MVYFEFFAHLAAAASFTVLGVYVYMHQRDLRRYARNSKMLYWVLLVLSGIFAAINVGRCVTVVAGLSESGVGIVVDKLAEYFPMFLPLALWFLLANKIVIQREACPSRVLAIGAHPDDIEIAAGAALAKMRDAGCQITGLVLSDGSEGGEGEVRPLEAKQGGAFLGLDRVVVERFPDTRLESQAVEITHTIEALIRQVEPDMILTHSAHDLHQDHQAVHEATLRAARGSLASILCYESPSVTPDFRPTYFVDVAQYTDVKLEAMREHWDQQDKPYMKAEVVRGKLAFRGAQAKVAYAEGFEVVRMLSTV